MNQVKTVDLVGLSAERRREVEANPSMVMFDGPWQMRNDPVVRLVLQVLGICAGLLIVRWIVVEVLDAMGDGDSLAMALVWRIPLLLLLLALCALIPFQAGRERRAGRIYLADSGMRMSMLDRKVTGDREMAQELYDGYVRGDLTYSGITVLNSRPGYGGPATNIAVRTYLEKRTDTANVGVSFKDGDQLVVWRPLQVPPGLGLTTVTGKRYMEYE